jgi:hypothetical protein
LNFLGIAASADGGVEKARAFWDTSVVGGDPVAPLLIKIATQTANRSRSFTRSISPTKCRVFVFDPARYRDLVELGGSDLRIDLNDLGRSDKR